MDQGEPHPTGVSGRVVARSLVWSGSGAILMRVGQLLVGIAAARIMSARDFGIFAITMVVYAIVVNVSELGVGSALIREHDDLESLGPTAVTLAMISATSLAAIMAATAPLLGPLLGSPASIAPIQVMSLVVLLAGPTSVPSALMTRDFRQDLRFRADVANFLVGNALLITLAIFGWGALALAWSRVAGQATSAIVLLVLDRHRFRPGWQRPAAAHLIRFGTPLMGSNMISFAKSNLDSIVIGRIRGPIPLGGYTLGNNVAAWPIGVLEPILINVGLPLVSRLRTNRIALVKFLQQALGLLAGGFFLASAMIAALSGPLVRALYTDKWAAAIPILAILALAGPFRALLDVMSDVLMACQASRSVFAINLVWIATLLPLMIVGVIVDGPLGAAFAQLLTLTLVVAPVALLRVSRVTAVGLREMSRGVARPLLAASAAAISAHFASLLLTSPWLGLMIGGLVGLAVFALLAWGWLRTTVSDIRDQLRTGSPAGVEGAP
jgi:lipopolysaccharide exporter